MKINIGIVSALLVCITTPVTSVMADNKAVKFQEARASDSNRQAKTVDEPKSDNKAEKKGLYAIKQQEGKQSKEASTTIKKDKADDQVDSVEEFNSGLSSMVADMMEDESLQEEDAEKEDLKD